MIQLERIGKKEIGVPPLSTPKLDLLWPSLLSNRKHLEEITKIPLAAPFWSAADESYRTFKVRFMLVGRATSGHYWADEFLYQLSKSPSKALTERKNLNRRLVKEHPKSSPFWKAFLAGSSCCGLNDSFSNSVWTNLAKIGVANRDIKNREDVFFRQEELAENTLRTELEEYDPTIVHFAVGNLGGNCIFRATNTKQEDWTPLAKHGPKNDIWFINSGKLKAIWTRHPNFAAGELIQAWTDQLIKLAES